MAYFPNGTSGMIYEEQVCAKCAHYGEGDDVGGCPVLLIHNLYNYDQCADTEHGKAIECILDLLIPRTKNDLGNEKCSLFAHKYGVTAQHLRDWEKYKAIMAEASGQPRQ